ncbi:hypothetical protein L1887_58202 [Cichorium endivia]|nr:hypothetical protein L1887_58202 [Cichorium endivia]
MSSSTVTPKTLTYVSGSSDSEQQLESVPAVRAGSVGSGGVHPRRWHGAQDRARTMRILPAISAQREWRLQLSTTGSRSRTIRGLPKHIHPVHVQDVNAALAFLHVRDDVPRKDWVVVGHSIGAWLTLAAIIQRLFKLGRMPQDGIFSVSALLKEYPDYDGFVAQAFLPQPSPAKYDVVSCENWPLALDGKQLHVLAFARRRTAISSSRASTSFFISTASFRPPRLLPFRLSSRRTGTQAQPRCTAKRSCSLSLYADTSIKNAQPAARRSHHSEGKCPQTMLDASIPKTNCSAGDSTNQGRAR